MFTEKFGNSHHLQRQVNNITPNGPRVFLAINSTNSTTKIHCSAPGREGILYILRLIINEIMDNGVFVSKINFFNYNILYINCEKLSGGAMKFTEFM